MGALCHGERKESGRSHFPKTIAKQNKQTIRKYLTLDDRAKKGGTRANSSYAWRISPGEVKSCRLMGDHCDFHRWEKSIITTEDGGEEVIYAGLDLDCKAHIWDDELLYLTIKIITWSE